MRKFILMMMLLAAISSGAAAEWVKVGSSSRLGGYDIHVDPATLSRDGNMVKVWNMMDFKTTPAAEGGRYSSIKEQLEYACKDNRWRVLSSTWHAKNMGNGVIIFSRNHPNAWEPIVAGGPRETLWKYACGMR